MWDQTGESQVYVLPRKAAEEQQRFDKTWMLSFLSPEITAYPAMQAQNCIITHQTSLLIRY
jgi:hypothetical protein